MKTPMSHWQGPPHNKCNYNDKTSTTTLLAMEKMWQTIRQQRVELDSIGNSSNVLLTILTILTLSILAMFFLTFLSTPPLNSSSSSAFRKSLILLTLGRRYLDNCNKQRCHLTKSLMVSMSANGNSVRGVRTILNREREVKIKSAVSLLCSGSLATGKVWLDR